MFTGDYDSADTNCFRRLQTVLDREQEETMENKKIYLISDASKKVKVESHVLRYWEDELKLPVKRNELGHRYYTEEDITEFQEIKKLKEQGLQLKAIRMILKNGKLTRLHDAGEITVEELRRMDNGIFSQTDIKETGTERGEREQRMMPAAQGSTLPEREVDEKVRRLEYLMKKLISEAVEESNEKFYEEVSERITKELDYQFRMQEEREEQRESRRLMQEEEHYRQLDEILRGKSGRKKPEKKEKEKKERKKLFKKTGAV